ncbi:hypothetical protein CA601_02050 [Paraburkholderia hospita]|nr:hypothetical protein CA601_02050 [Paraburkholderia hospita]
MRERPDHHSVTMVMKISAIAWMAVLATYSPGVCSRTAASLVVHQTKEFIQLCVCIMTSLSPLTSRPHEHGWQSLNSG